MTICAEKWRKAIIYCYYFVLRSTETWTDLVKRAQCTAQWAEYNLYHIRRITQMHVHALY